MARNILHFMSSGPVEGGRQLRFEARSGRRVSVLSGTTVRIATFIFAT